MSQSDEGEKPFTVSDRRHFTPEGRPREETDGGAAESPREEAPAESPRGDAAGEGPQAGPKTGAPRAAAGRADFSGFVMGLAAQGGALLGGQGLPEGVDAGEALDAARSVIAILEMLKEKTTGNLRDPEVALLDELLYQLRMAYVEKTRAGGA